MNATLETWNNADETEAFDAMIACCGARRWASAMVALRPIRSVLELSEAADRLWNTMTEVDWMEAFACHPRIGERKAAHAIAKSTAWSSQEQSSVSSAKERVLAELAEGNARYEHQFGFNNLV
jgi:OHCU decarboxylase